MPEEYGPNDPIPLARAAQLFFRGALTKSALRTEARKGNLEIIQIANKDFVTRNGIERMMEKCRKKSDQPGSGSDQTPAHGLSRMDQSVSPRTAAKAKLQQLRESLPPTSQPNTSRGAEVVRLK
ncbi:hypothetical protein [Rhizobium sp. RU36D]|uniref:hypothetical protein n=1 Tax=Rhizobium sp. RU36D TaxID=1907415 RepID=UPI0009D870E6|nr:hypothetical protein [Rhizobium sp. RU36D]SMD20291.1 hypothetical protein SAMN05880593_15212 [Rhizobium sp. RU36D]